MMTPKILFLTAVLFASALVGYPANEIDWGKGRPGVRVVTNAPSRAEFDALVSGNSQYASVAAIASNALTAVTVTGPQSNVIANAASVAYVDMLTQTNRVTSLWDYADTNLFQRIENGTGFVYRIGYRWYTLVPEGQPQLVSGMPYPIDLGSWEGSWGVIFVSRIAGEGETWVTNVFWNSESNLVTDVFRTNYAYNSGALYAVWNTSVVSQVALKTDVDAVQASVDALSDRVDSIELIPESLLRYGDLNTTNTPGYAGFTVANGSPRGVVAIPSSTITTNTFGFEYPVGSNGFVSASVVAQAAGASGTFGSSVMTLLDANDVPLASNTFTAGTFTSAATGRPYFTNSLTYAAGFVTNAKLRVSYTIWRTNTSAFASQLFTGTTYPMTLTCKTAPLPYVTFDQSESRYVTQSQLTAYPTFPQVTNIVQEAGQSWIEVDIGALRASFTGTPASVGQLEGTTYGVVGLSNAVSACAFGLLSLRPMEESKTNLVLCVCSSSGLSLDNQATYSRFTCVSWTNTSVTVYESYPTFTNGVSTATLRIPVYRNVSINHTQLAAQPQDTARDRTVFNVRYRWE